MIYTRAAGPITCRSLAKSQKEDKNECIPNMPCKALCNTYHVLLGMSGGVVTDDVIYESYKTHQIQALISHVPFGHFVGIARSQAFAVIGL